jgi:hypothetical protein
MLSSVFEMKAIKRGSIRREARGQNENEMRGIEARYRQRLRPRLYRPTAALAFS